MCLLDFYLSSIRVGSICCCHAAQAMPADTSKCGAHMLTGNAVSLKQNSKMLFRSATQQLQVLELLAG